MRRDNAKPKGCTRQTRKAASTGTATVVLDEDQEPEGADNGELSPGDVDRLTSEIQKYKNTGCTLPDWFTIAEDLNLEYDLAEACGAILWEKGTIHTPNVDVDPIESVLPPQDNAGKQTNNSEAAPADVASGGDRKRKASYQIRRAKRTPPQHEFSVGTLLLMYFHHWEADATVSKETTTGKEYTGSITSISEDNNQKKTVYRVTFDTPDKFVNEYYVGPIRKAVKDHKILLEASPLMERTVTDLQSVCRASSTTVMGLNSERTFEGRDVVNPEIVTTSVPYVDPEMVKSPEPLVVVGLVNAGLGTVGPETLNETVQRMVCDQVSGLCANWRRDMQKEIDFLKVQYTQT